MRLRVLIVSVLALVACGSLAAIVLAQRADRSSSVRVTLRNVGGVAIGKVVMSARSAKAPVEVRVTIRRQQQGFHGFHVHAVGTCEPPSFMSAAGHLKADGAVHGAHRGDMPSLLVKRNGTASLRFTTDGFRIGDLRDADGSAVMVHAGPDNFANIPRRYAPDGPDQATQDTGDSGVRVACGAISAAGDAR